jgi:hypothetical protein
VTLVGRNQGDGEPLAGGNASAGVVLPARMAERARAMHELLRRSHETGREPWGSMYTEGHGRHWNETTAFITEHCHHWQTAVAAL